MQNLLWLETNTFLVVYTEQPEEDTAEGEEPEHSYGVYIVSTASRTDPWCYRRLQDPCMPYGLRERNSHYYFALIQSWYVLTC